MIIISKGAKIKCKKCHKLYEIKPDDFGEPDLSSDERNMGYETQYVWQYELSCEKCNNDLIVTVEGYEYPEGVFNYEEFNSEGCIIIENPELEVHYDDDYHEEENYENN